MPLDERGDSTLQGRSNLANSALASKNDEGATFRLDAYIMYGSIPNQTDFAVAPHLMVLRDMPKEPSKGACFSHVE